MRPAAELLFEEFAASWARGEHPDVRDYLERAGDDRDTLAVLLDGFIAVAPVQPPSEETLATFAQLVPGERETPPMLAARVRMGLRRQQVVERLIHWCGIDPAKEHKVARYYHELETGLLDPRGVQPFVWHNLAKIFGTGIRGLMLRPNEPPPVLVAAYFRQSDDVAGVDLLAVPAPQERVPRDEVDMLFTGSARN